MTYDAKHGVILLFGGDGGSSFQNDLWQYDGASWTMLTPPVKPPGRYWANFVYDEIRQVSFLWGGVAPGSQGAWTDMWQWDGTNWTQLHPATMPPAEWDTASTFDRASSTTVWWGGSDTWTWDGTNWTKYSPTVAPQSAITSGGGEMTYDQAIGQVVMRVAGDTWTWDGVAKQWALQTTCGVLVCVFTNAVPPTPSGGDTGIAYDTIRGDVVLFGAGNSAYPDPNEERETWLWGAPGPPVIAKTADRGPNGVYGRGEPITYDITLSAPGFWASSSAINVTDTFPSGLSPITGSVKFGSQPCNANTIPACVFNGQTLKVTGITLDPSHTVDVTYSAIAVGLDRACSVIANQATATNSVGTSSASVPVTVCDNGLGLENWWSYVKRDTGPQGTAYVNAANGNLVLQQTDSTPVQAHGHLAYVARRFYNSEDATLLTFPGSIGAGWNLNVDQGDSLIGDAASATGLYVPTAQSVTNPTGITLVDRDGTRHVFRPRAVSLSVDATTLGGVAHALTPRALGLDPGYDKVLVDQLYDAPPGVHLGMWRYTEINSSCLPTSACAYPSKVLGFGAERPDRVRYEFTADGRELDMQDGNGVELRWTYENSTAVGQPFPRPLQIYERRSCSLPLASSCRSFRFAYPDSQTVSVTDPAGRATTYHLDTATPRHLSSVDNPDGTHLYYTYGGCGGSANQLCSASDPKGDLSKFSYSSVTLGPARVASLTDRRGNPTNFTYSANDFSAYLTADRGTERQRFSNIDDSGRVGQIDEGDTSSNVFRSQSFFWDTTTATCRQPSNTVDNLLCRSLRSTLNSTPYEDTHFTYNDEGRVLVSSRYMGSSAQSITQTWGYHAQYVEAQGAPQTYDDAVGGNGVVASAGPATGRTDAQALFAISDLTQSLTPRGNATGSAVKAYLTTHKPDNNSNEDPNATVDSNGSCGLALSHNTGNICEVDAPSPAGSGAAVTLYVFNPFGERIAMTTPKSVAESQGLPQYHYTYYADSDLDLSGLVSAGGWLKAVTDPTGNFVAFGYDRAGNVVRTWDRNATQGHQPTDAISSLGSLYRETLYGSGAGALSAPWRSQLTSKDPLGNLTSFAVDLNGNVTAIRPPRGNAAGSASYDVTQTFDANDNQLTRLMPAEAAANKPTTYTYDQFDNRASTTDPNGNVSAYQYDSVNRLTASLWTRGAWPTDTTTVPPACRQSVAGDAPIPSARILCSTTSAYDGVDNATAAQDGNHQTTTYTYDGAHREISRVQPRNDGTYTTLRTDTIYDPDGNVTDICPPREFTEGSGTCSATTAYSQHRTYDSAGLLATNSTYRASTTAPNTTAYTYDADGNAATIVDANQHTVRFTYDLLDRKVSQAAPRDASTNVTTAWNHDPVGNVTAVIRPAPSGASRTSAYSYDANNRMVDKVDGADNVLAAATGLVDGNGGGNIRTRVMYDPDGHVAARLDPGAFITSTTTPDATFMLRTDYDVDGRSAASYLPRYDAGAHSDLGLSSSQSSQCPTGVAPQAVSGVPAYPAGVGVCSTKYQFDYAGNRTRVTLPTSTGPDNRYLAYNYTDDNLVASIDSPSPVTAGARVTSASKLYDGDGKQVKVTDALGNTQTTSYFADELPSQVTGQPNGSIAHVSTFAYDANGNQTGITDPLGHRTTTAHTADNLVQSSSDAAGDLTSYTYDGVGNPTQVTSPSANAKDASNSSGTPTTNTYTFDNLLLTTNLPVTPDGTQRRQTIYAYDAGGRKTSQHVQIVAIGGAPLSDGGTQSFAYYNDDRPQSETGRNSETITKKYDPGANLISAADSTSGGSTISASYYLDHLLRSADDASRTAKYTYDGAGHRAARTDAMDGSSAAYSTTYTYLDPELPASMSSSLTQAGSTSWTYDAAGRPAQETDPNGQSTSWAFNPDNTLASLTLKNSSASTLASWSYSYDGAYRITNQGFTGVAGSGGSLVTGTSQYGYDAANRLSSFTQGTNPARTISWDHNSNRLSYGTQSFTYNADNSIATSSDSAIPGSTRTYAYMPFGGLSSDGCTNNSYDGFDRLTQATGIGSTACPTPQTASYQYDALDRQRSSTRPSGTTNLHYDGLAGQATVETAASTGIDTAYELAPGGAAKAVTVNPAAPTSQEYLTDDGQGSIATTTSTGQAVACTARYDPWGTALGSQSQINACNTGSTPDTHFYKGARRDPTTGEYQMGSRTYDPAKAGFLTPDSYRADDPGNDLGLGTDPLTQNRYAYVNGDPVNLVDPDGHWGWPSCGWCGRAWNWVRHQVHRAVHAVSHAVATAVHAAGNIASTGVRTVRRYSHQAAHWVRRTALPAVAGAARHVAAVTAGAAASGVGAAHDSFAVPVAKAALGFGGDTAGDLASRNPGRMANGAMNVVMAVSMLSGLGEVEDVGAIGIRAVAPGAEDLGLAAARRFAVRQAWRDEGALVSETGQGTRFWTEAEQTELAQTGKVSGYQGHHINSVKGSPDLAGNPNNIEFLRRTEHLAAHGGNWQNVTFGDLLDRSW
jgi:RHS repeat-associated protein